MLVVLAFLISDYRERQRQSIHISEGEQGIEITEGDKKIIIPKEQPPPPPPPVEELAPSRKLPPAAPSSPVKKPSPGMEAPAPPPPSVGQPQQQVRRVSTQVLYANAVHRVHPEWPPFARRSGWVPPVEVQVVVDENGTVTSAEAISGPLPLQPAAVDAARQWKFQPFMLDGEPTPMTGLLVFGGRIRRFERFHLQ
jgi:protein TonB